MHAHVDTTDRDAFSIITLLSPQQITEYHVQVFGNYGLPPYTFGGAPFGKDGVPAKKWQDVTGGLVWCPGCDTIP